MVATRAAATTINSTAGGGVSALIYSEIRSRGELVSAPDVSSGILASLVAITPACASVNPHEALFVGLVAGGLALAVNDVLKGKFCQIDDPVGAVGVHAAAAIWGLLCVGLFADGSLPGIEVKDGLFHGGGFELLALQLLGIVVIGAWGAVNSTLFFYIVGVCLGGTWRCPRRGLRVPEDSEIEGIDRSIHRSVRSLHVEKDAIGSAKEGSLGAVSRQDGQSDRPMRACTSSAYARQPYREQEGSSTMSALRIGEEFTQEVTEEAEASNSDYLCGNARYESDMDDDVEV